MEVSSLLESLREFPYPLGLELTVCHAEHSTKLSHLFKIDFFMFSDPDSCLMTSYPSLDVDSCSKSLEVSRSRRNWRIYLFVVERLFGNNGRDHFFVCYVRHFCVQNIAIVSTQLVICVVG
jgi:hypothetical protein